MAPDDLLDEAGRGLLAVGSADGPVVWPVGFWWDGASLWITAPVASTLAAHLQATDRCALWVPPIHGHGPGAVLTGPPRVFSLRDPLALALHGPAISGAVAALALRNAPALPELAQQAARAPSTLLPSSHAVVRVAVAGARGVVPPAPAAGVAPALPAAVPPDVRRLLSGNRRVAVALLRDGLIDIEPAAWSAGPALSFGEGRVPAAGDPLAVALEVQSAERPARNTGVVLNGRLRPPSTLAAQRVRWWHGAGTGEAPVPAAVTGIELPD